jgi:methylisocitrate lyase
VIFAEALTSADEFGRFGSVEMIGPTGQRVPLMANMTEFGKTPYLTAAQFEDLGFDVVIFPMMAFRVMLGAVDAAMGELSSKGTQAGMLDRMKTRAELYDLIDYDRWTEAETRWVTDL